MSNIKLRNFALIPLLLCVNLAFGQAATIEKLTIQGNKNTNTEFILDLVKSETGQNLDSTQVQRDVQMLIRLPSIAHAYFQVHALQDSLYELVIGVEENFTIIPYADIQNRGTQLWWTAGVSEHNLFGRNMMLDVFYRYSGKNSYGISYRAPFFLNGKWGFATSFKSFTSDEPVYFNTTQGIYEYKNRSTELLGLYQLNFYNRIELGGSYFKETYTHLRGAEEVPDRPDVIQFDKYLFKGFHQYRHLTQYYHYLSGYEVNTQFQHVRAVQSGLIDFNMLDVSLVRYARIGDKGNLASRALAGISTNNQTPFAAYAVDNQNNLRGVGDRVKRASAQLALSGEYRHTVFENPWFATQTVGFADFASFRLAGAPVDNFLAPENLYLQTGVGLRFILKRVYSASLRIDYGIGLLQNNPHGLVIGLGQYF